MSAEPNQPDAAPQAQSAEAAQRLDQAMQDFDAVLAANRRRLSLDQPKVKEAKPCQR